MALHDNNAQKATDGNPLAGEPSVVTNTGQVPCFQDKEPGPYFIALFTFTPHK